MLSACMAMLLISFQNLSLFPNNSRILSSQNEDVWCIFDLMKGTIELVIHNMLYLLLLKTFDLLVLSYFLQNSLDIMRVIPKKANDMMNVGMLEGYCVCVVVDYFFTWKLVRFSPFDGCERVNQSRMFK